MNDFIFFNKDWLDSHIFKNPIKLKAWMILLSKAALEPTTLDLHNSIVHLKINQCAVTLSMLAREFGWNKNRVKRFITRLHQEGFIEIVSSKIFNINADRINDDINRNAKFIIIININMNWLHDKTLDDDDFKLDR